MYIYTPSSFLLFFNFPQNQENQESRIKNQEEEYSNNKQMELPSILSTQNPPLLVEAKQPHDGENETLVQSKLSNHDDEVVVVVVEEEEIEEEVKKCESRLSDRFDDNIIKNGDDDEDEDDQACSGLERLKRHRVEVAGSVWIPDIWGQEELLKDWIDCSAFEASFVPSSILSAKSALVEERRRATTSSLRIENRC